MFRAIPTNNKVLDKKWHQRRLELLQNRLQTIKPMITTRFRCTSVPNQRQQGKTKAHSKSKSKSKTKSKATQLQLERWLEIERNNKVLLDKLAHIMQPGNFSSPGHGASRTGLKHPIEKKSLHTECRKKELIKVALENQVLLHLSVGHLQTASGTRAHVQ